MSENHGRREDLGDEEFVICLWDTFDNETIKVHGCDDLEEAKRWVRNHYLVDGDGADRVDIVGKGGVVASFSIKGDRVHDINEDAEIPIHLVLTRKEWVEVYYALETKHDNVWRGKYGADEEHPSTADWARTLRSAKAKVAHTLDDCGVKY